MHTFLIYLNYVLQPTIRRRHRKSSDTGLQLIFNIPNSFSTQVLYKHQNQVLVLGWIVSFYEASDTIKTYNSTTSLKQCQWLSPTHVTHTQAIELLLSHHKLDVLTGVNRIITIPQTFSKDWRY